MRPCGRSTFSSGCAFAPVVGGPRLTEHVVVARFLDEPEVARWLDRYPRRPSTDATFDKATRRWTVRVWSGKAGEVALGKVEDGDGRVSEAWTGPQVAWKMARGRVGSFGGTVLNAWWVWIPLSAVFLVGLVDRRRLWSLHTLDLLVLLSFGLSLWFFNRGEIFRSAPLAVPPLAYLLVRTAWIGFRGRAVNPALSWPVWALAAVAVFLGGLRIGLNLESPRGVIDVGYAGVIGADRILDGQAPYGHMPVEDSRPACGKADADGAIRDRIQQNGRCESANPRGDTYGPMAYLAYVPAVLTFGWSGKWDALPAAHATAIGFDLLVILGLIMVGRRFGGTPLAVALAFGWVAFPFTAYAVNSNTNGASAGESKASQFTAITRTRCAVWASRSSCPRRFDESADSCEQLRQRDQRGKERQADVGFRRPMTLAVGWGVMQMSAGAACVAGFPAIAFRFARCRAPLDCQRRRGGAARAGHSF